MLERLVVADDLSGAAESAATFLLRTTRIAVLLAQAERALPSPARRARASSSSTPTPDTVAAAAADAVARVCRAAARCRADARAWSRRSTRCCAATSAPRCARSPSLLERHRWSSRPPSRPRAAPSSTGCRMVDGRPAGRRPTCGRPSTARPPVTVADVLAGLDHVDVPLAVVRDARRPARPRWPTAERARCRRRLRRGDRRRPRCRRGRLAGAREPAARGFGRARRGRCATARARLRRDPARSTPATRDPGAVHRAWRPRSWSRWSVPRRPGSPSRSHALADSGCPVLTLDPRELLESPGSGPQTASPRPLTTRGLVLALDQSATVDPLAARRLTTALAAAPHRRPAGPPSCSRPAARPPGPSSTRSAVRPLTPLSTQRRGRDVAHPRRTASSITRPGSHGASATSLRDALGSPLPRHLPLPDRPDRTSTADLDR